MESEQLERIRHAVVTELNARPMPRFWWHDALALSAATLVVAGSVSTLATWSRHPRYGEPAWWGVLSLLFIVIISSSWAAFRPSFGRSAIAISSAMAVVVVAGIVGLATRSAQPSLWADADCALVEVVVSAAPGWLALTALRRFAFRAQSAWAAGIAAGSSGLLVLHATCPVDTALHAMTFHVAPWIAGSILMVMVRSKLSSSSAVP